MPCFERHEGTAVNHLRLALSLVFLALYTTYALLSLDMSHPESLLPPRKRTLAPKLKDANNAAEPEIRMRQRSARSRSATPGNGSSLPSRNDTPETSNVNASEPEPGSSTVLGVLYTLIGSISGPASLIESVESQKLSCMR